MVKLFSLLETIEAEEVSDGGTVPSGKLNMLNEDESSAMYTALANNSLGSNAAGKRLSLALLKRLNLSVMLKQEGVNGGDAIATDAYLEPILPNKATKKAWGDVWPNKADRDISAPKLGNLCLVSKKGPSKEMKVSFPEKKSRYASEIWPLTAKLGERDVWDDVAIKDNSAMMVELIKSIWG